MCPNPGYNRLLKRSNLACLGCFKIKFRFRYGKFTISIQQKLLLADIGRMLRPLLICFLHQKSYAGPIFIQMYIFVPFQMNY